MDDSSARSASATRSKDDLGIGPATRTLARFAVAAEFGFPLALAAAVLGFLLIQGYVDRRDPKLRMAPQSMSETYVRFSMEEQL